MEQDRQYMRAQPLRMVGLVFLIVGLVFLLAGAFIYDRQKAGAETMQEGTGVIVDFTQHGNPYIVYEKDGRTYEAQLGFSSSDMEVGDELPILFDPMIPEHVQIGGWGALFLPLLFMGLGAVFALMGVALLLLQRRLLQESETTYWQ